MRDLAKQDFTSNRRKLNLKVFLRVFLFFAAVLGILVFIKFYSPFSKSLSASSVVLKEAPRGLKPITAGGSGEINSEGVNLTSKNATFTDVRYKGAAKATAKRMYGAGTYLLSVSATLPDPEGNKYGLWLVGDGDVFLVDYLKGSKTSWGLELSDKDKYPHYDGIWITLERMWEDENPEEHVLEGSF